MRLPEPWAVLHLRLFMALWSCALVSNIGTLMQEVGVTWLMTSLDSSPIMVSLIQTAEAVPFFLLALPAGALADILDRRRLVLFSQGWMFLLALLLGVLTFSNLMTPAWLLILTALLGLGTALNGPVYQAIIPELVPANQLSGAIALNSAGFNLARAIGPGIGGLVVAAAGAGATFLLNAASFLGVMLVLYRWERPVRQNVAPTERFVGAMRAGIRYFRHAEHLQTVLARAAAFILGASAFWALFPLVVRFRLDLSAAGYGLLLGCFGVGAIGMATLMPMVRRHLSLEAMVAAATVIFASTLLTIALSQNVSLISVSLLLGGAAWLAMLTTFNTSVQMNAPEWVRGRALAFYLLVLFGSLAVSSAVWGGVAERFGVPTALLLAAGALVLTVPLARRYPLSDLSAGDLTPSGHWPIPAALEAPTEDGPVFVTVEYRIDPAHAVRFIDAMEGMRRLRLRDGGLRWELLSDMSDGGRYVETFLVESWAEHLRQHARVTVTDRTVEDTVRAYHIGTAQPKVQHFIAMSMPDR